MRYLILAVLLLSGCLGTTPAHNPMKQTVEPTDSLWWRDTTAEIDKTDNPWEKFVPKTNEDEWSDPWSRCEEPPLFPKDWKPSKTSLKNKRLLRLHQQRLKMLKEKRKKLKEKRRLDRLRRRSIIDKEQERKTF